MCMTAKIMAGIKAKRDRRNPVTPQPNPGAGIGTVPKAPTPRSGVAKHTTFSSPLFKG